MTHDLTDASGCADVSGGAPARRSWLLRRRLAAGLALLLAALLARPCLAAAGERTARTPAAAGAAHDAPRSRVERKAGAATPAARPGAATPAARPAQVRAVTVVGMTVADVAVSAAFYADALAFEKVSDVEVSGPEYERLWGVPGLRARVVRMRLGHEDLELTEYVTPKGKPFPPDFRGNVLWFQHVAIVVADMEAAYERVRAHGAQAVSSEPQILPASNAAVAGIAACYFRDPDGHYLELIHFPAGKGDPRWQDARGRLFLGIDHTAIGIADTAASLAFYRDALGFRVAGESLNVGREQEALTNVPGARVRITGLRAPGGLPGIEFLEYEAPRADRSRFDEPRSNDIAHWHPTVTVADVGAAAQTLAAAGYRVLGEPVTLPSPVLGFTRAVLVRDPDGHALQLVEP